MSIFFRPESFEPESIGTLMFLQNEEVKCIERELSLPDEPRMIIREDVIELCAPMERFQYAVIEQGVIEFSRYFK